MVIYRPDDDPFVLDLVDANVTPDKRQIYMQDEKVLLAVIKVGQMYCYFLFTIVVGKG